MITSAPAVVAFSATLPPVMVSAPAKFDATVGVCVPTAALLASAATLVVLATVNVVAELIWLMYQPAFAASPTPLIPWPGTKLAVLGTVRRLAVLAETTCAAVAPLTVPRTRLAGTAVLWLMPNWVALMICEITVPAVTPAPETG